jgi:hypothetical protein
MISGHADDKAASLKNGRRVGKQEKSQKLNLTTA